MLQRTWLFVGILSIAACIKQTAAPLNNVELKDLAGKHYALIDLEHSGRSGGYGSPVVFEVGWKKGIGFSPSSQDFQVFSYQLEGNAADEISAPENEIQILDGGAQIVFENETYTQFEFINPRDRSLEGIVWKMTLPSGDAADCPQQAGSPETTVSMNTNADGILMIPITQRGVGCNAHSMQFAVQPVSNESHPRVSHDRKYLWLSEGIYRRNSN